MTTRDAKAERFVLSVEGDNLPLSALADADLAARAAAGGRDAFNELVLRHEGRLFRFLSRNAADHADAEDAMQEAWVKAYLNLRRYDARRSFTTWLFTIALRELRTAQRRHGKRTESMTHPGSRQAATPPDALENQELWAAAKRTVNAQQYTALWLRYAEGLDLQEVARIMRRPRVWVSVSIHRACAALRQSMGGSP